MRQSIWLTIIILGCVVLGAQVVQPGGGGGGGTGFPITLGSTSIASGSTTTTLTGFTSIGSASFAGTGATQTVVNLTQGTAAAAPPANSIQFGAPTSVTSSYLAMLPILAPTDSGGDVWVVPNGGGTGTWQPYGGSVTLGANTFLNTQTIDTSASGDAKSLILKSTNATNLATIDMSSAGGHEWQLVAAGTLFGGNCFYLFDATAVFIQSAWCGTNNVLRNDGAMGWSSNTDPTAAIDTGLSRDSAGIVDVGNGTVGDKSGSMAMRFAYSSGVQSVGTKFTTSGCSVSSTTGGAAAGKFTLGANTCSVVVTMNGATGLTASNGWACSANDQTSATVFAIQQTASNATTATFSIPATAGATDVISFLCMGY